jgi:FkbM family methyltransferase
MRRNAGILAGLAVFGLAVVFLLSDKYKNEGVASPTRAAANRIVPPAFRTDRPLDTALSLLAEQPSFSIVQIGAYIGNDDADPLYEFLCEHLDPARARSTGRNTKVVLVEPIREYFDLLCENYSIIPKIEFENVAIAETAGVMDMYRLDVNPLEHGYPAWLAEMSSLKKERMEELWDKHERNQELKQFYLEHRVVEKVNCMTLQQLFDKHQIRQLDLLQVDAEGYDFEILKTLDFDRITPRFINYERVLLQEDEPACREMLSAQGYALIDWGQDTLCIRID